MKRRAAMLILGILVPFGQGQARGYAGLGVSRVLLTAPTQYGLPVLPELQVGGHAAPEFGSVELRASFGTILLFSSIGFDALASVSFSDASLRLYLGGGPDVLLFSSGHVVPDDRPTMFSGLHGTVGVEPLTGSFRPFAELQPAVALLDGETVFGVRARAGLNFYF